MFFLSSKSNKNTGDMLEGVAYAPDGLVFYSSGLRKYKESGRDVESLKSGRFVIKYAKDNCEIIRADRDGNELIFYFSNSDFWCVSSSYLALIIYLKNNNIPVVVSKLELSKVFIQTSLFEQPYNGNFSVKGVRLLGKNEKIIISGSSLSIDQDENDFDLDTSGVVQRVVQFVQTSRTIISSFVSNNSVDLELSGGVDSRIVLGLVLPYRDEIYISSDRNRKNDYLIANFIASLFGIEIRYSSDSNYGINNNKEKWILYKLASIGVSRTNPGPNSGAGTKFSKLVRLNGAGGGSGKVFYNINEKAYLSLIEKSPLYKIQKENLKEDFLMALRQAGFEKSPPQAMVELYANYRQRLFAGRAWYTSLLGVIYSPMNDVGFQSILNAPDISEIFQASLNEILEKNLLSLFILCLLDKSLPLIRFDDKNKDFEIEDIRKMYEITSPYKDLVSQSKMPAGTVYGEVRGGEVCPDWLTDYFSECAIDSRAYDDFLYNDILYLVDSLKELNFIDPGFLEILEVKIFNKELSRPEKLMCLHLAETLKLADAFCD